VEQGPITGWTPVFPRQPPPPLRPGISLQALGSFAGYHRTHVRRMLSTHTADELAQLGVPVARMWELGIPLDAYYFYIPLEHPLGWTGYLLEIDGTLIDAPVPRDATVFLDALNPHAPLRILAWRRRVIYQPTQEWVETRWQPGYGDQRYVHRETAIRTVLEAATADTALARAWQLLRKIEGRPPQSKTYPDAEGFVADLRRTIALLRAHNIAPTQPRVHERLPRAMGFRQFQRDFAQYVTKPTRQTWKRFLDQG
jgi:hypothetical protein